MKTFSAVVYLSLKIFAHEVKQTKLSLKNVCNPNQNLNSMSNLLSKL